METKNKQNKSGISTNLGFTLIELLVVIAIIGLLASVVLLALNSARARARDVKRIADMNQMAKVMELYFGDYSSYPTSSTSGRVDLVLGYLTPTYLNTLPVSPQPADGNCKQGPGSGSNDYYFSANSNGTPAQAVTNTYYITFCLGGQAGSLGPGIHTLTQAGFQ